MNIGATIYLDSGLVWHIHTTDKKTIAKITIRGQEYSGQVSNPEGTETPDQWIEWSLLKGLYGLWSFEWSEAIRELHMHVSRWHLPAMH
jgi:hypothetical protein